MTSTPQYTWDLLTCDAVDHEGTMHWYDESGRHHRDNGPAIIYADGTRFWFKHGEFHRNISTDHSSTGLMASS